MSKKTSRKRRRKSTPNVPRYEIPVESDQPQAPESKPVQAVAPSPSKRRTGFQATHQGKATIDDVNWASEYPFVLGDLRRLAIVSGSMVVLLLALNIILA